MTVLLMAVNVVVYALQVLNADHSVAINRYFALSNRGLSQGYLWQLITFQFLHSGLWHLLLNLVAIYFFGRMVEDRLGKASFIKIYLLSGTIGGLFQAFMGWTFPEHFGAVVGASAGAFGLIAAATMLEPDSTILVSFIIPLKAKYFLVLAAGFSIIFMFSPDKQVAHAAHLGGLLTGVLYVRWGAVMSSFLGSLRPRGMRFRAKDFIKVQGRQRGRNRRAAELPPDEFISREVDPILDKISAHGIQSLTPEEKETLEAARAKMERRGA